MMNIHVEPNWEYSYTEANNEYSFQRVLQLENQ